MSLTYKPAVEMTIDQLAALFTKAFAGYIGGTVQLDRVGMSAMLARENIDLNLSMVAWREDEPLGFGLISRQGWTSRLAGMGVVPEAQGQQVGFHLLSQLIEAAKARQEKTMVLEAFEQNTRAVKLYEKSGFHVVRRLYGYTLQNPESTSDDPLVITDPAEIARKVIVHAREDLPWQMSGTAIARVGAPSVGYRLDDAWALISDPTKDTIAIRTLIVPPQLQRQRYGTAILQSLWAIHPGKTWTVPAICPEEFDGFFQKLGFVRQALNQVEMRKYLLDVHT